MLPTVETTSLAAVDCSRRVWLISPISPVRLDAWFWMLAMASPVWLARLTPRETLLTVFSMLRMEASARSGSCRSCR